MRNYNIVLFIVLACFFPVLASAEVRERGLQHVPVDSTLKFEESLKLFAGESLNIGTVILDSWYFGLEEYRLACELENRSTSDYQITAGQEMHLVVLEVYSTQKYEDGPLVDGNVSYFFGGSVQLNCQTQWVRVGVRTFPESYNKTGVKFRHLQELLSNAKIKFEINPK